MCEIMNSILIVEDDRLLREMLKDIFESNGFKVRVALDGQDGLAMIRDLKKRIPRREDHRYLGSRYRHPRPSSGRQGTRSNSCAQEAVCAGCPPRCSE